MPFARQLPQAAGLAVAAIGLLVVLGWVLDVALLKTFFPGTSAMRFNTALEFVLGGASLWLLGSPGMRRWVRLAGRTLAAVVALFGLLTLSEYVFNWNPSPSGMAPHTASIFVLLGVSLFLLDDPSWRGRRVAPVFVFVSIVLTLLALLASLRQLFGVAYVPGVPGRLGVAVHTCLAFTLLGVGVFFARTDGSLMRILAGSGSGGVMARRLLPAVCLLPLAVGWLAWLGWRHGFYDTEARACIIIISYVVLLFLIVRANARRLNESDTRRAHAEKEREELVLELQTALGEIKQLSGFLPICAHCKKIRDAKGYWNQMEIYIAQHSEATFSHAMCDDCIRELYPEVADDVLKSIREEGLGKS